MTHLPRWLLPVRPWGAKGRPDMPEMHATRNRQTAASLRLDRLERLRAQGEFEAWREQRRD